MVLCSLCGKIFSRMGVLRVHVDKVHGASLEKSITKKFSCSCGSSFTRKFALDRHKQHFHPDEVEPKPESKSKKVLEREHSCPHCIDKAFSAKGSLWAHIKKYHGSDGLVLRQDSMECPSCSLRFGFLREVEEHLSMYHDVEIKMEYHQFQTEQDFLIWKKNEESSSLSRFIRLRKPSGKTSYLYCHRSGYQKRTVESKRKGKPSVKIGKCCPARMVTTLNEDGTIVLKYYKTHVGHLMITASEPLKTTKNKSDKTEKILNNTTADDVLPDYILDDGTFNIYYDPMSFNISDIGEPQDEKKSKLQDLVNSLLDLVSRSPDSALSNILEETEACDKVTPSVTDTGLTWESSITDFPTPSGLSLSEKQTLYLIEQCEDTSKRLAVIGFFRPADVGINTDLDYQYTMGT